MASRLASTVVSLCTLSSARSSAAIEMSFNVNRKYSLEEKRELGALIAEKKGQFMYYMFNL